MAKSTNHLDKLLGKVGEHPGVQLKRTDCPDKTSYQVETKIRGAVPARNIGFGSFDSLEKAKRAYNLGMYIMGSDTIYYRFPDHNNLEAECPPERRKKFQDAVLSKDYKGISQMRDDIKSYLHRCRCAPDSRDFKNLVFRYFQVTEKQKRTPRMYRPRSDRNASDPSPSPGVGMSGEQHGAVPAAESADQSNQMHSSGADALRDAPPAPTQARKRPYVRCPVDNSTDTHSNGEEYRNLPMHYYGIIAHAGNLSTHEYPPQLDCEGAFICPCFFNHNFNARSEHSEAMGPIEEDWLNKELSVIKKYHKISDSLELMVICIQRLGYNYEGSECVQDYYKGPLPIQGIHQDNTVFDFQTDYSIYDNLCAEDENPQQQNIDGINDAPQRNMKVVYDASNNAYWAHNPNTNERTKLVPDAECENYVLKNPQTNQLHRVNWDKDLSLYILDPDTNLFIPHFC